MNSIWQQLLMGAQNQIPSASPASPDDALMREILTQNATPNLQVPDYGPYSSQRLTPYGADLLQVPEILQDPNAKFTRPKTSLNFSQGMNIAAPPKKKAPLVKGKLPATPTQVLAKAQGGPPAPQVINPNAQEARSKAEDQIYSLLQQYSENPMDSDQREALSKLKGLIGQYQDQPRDGLAGMDLSPLAALTDSWTGSNLLAGYNRPETNAERLQTAMKDQNLLLQRTNDLSNTQQGLLKTKIAALLGIEKANVDKAIPGLINQDRTKSIIHRSILRDIKKAPELKQSLQAFNRLSNSVALLREAAVKTPQQFNELQQNVRKALINSDGAAEERAKTQFTNYGLDWARVKQYFSDNPVDISGDVTEFINHLIDLVEVEQKNIRGQAEKMIQAKAAGQGSFYAKNPEEAMDLDDVMEKTLEQFEPKKYERLLKPEPKGKKKAPAPQTDYHALSDAELDALLKQRGIQ